MNLDEAKKNKVTAWIAEGLKVSEIQKRIDKELGVTMTYMEVRLLLDDLSLVPKDQPAPQPDKPIGEPAPGLQPASTPAGSKSPLAPAVPAAEAAPGAGGVAVTVDAVTQPGTMVSGKVTFSDGNSAAWYLDQMGRLGLSPKQPGYRPSPTDLEEFQLELQTELQKLGF